MQKPTGRIPARKATEGEAISRPAVGEIAFKSLNSFAGRSLGTKQVQALFWVRASGERKTGKALGRPTVRREGPSSAERANK